MKRKVLQVVCLVLVLAAGWITYVYFVPDPILPSPLGSALMSRDERDQARNSLREFFALLHDGRYAGAIRFYGGEYQTLRDDNPDVFANDYASLFERACRQNGFMCLEIRSILQEVPMSTNEIRYTVEFTTTDGKLFVRGPCCGATEAEMPSVSRFHYSVKRVGNRFLVQDLPVYVP